MCAGVRRLLRSFVCRRSALQPGATTGKLVAYDNIADLLNKIGEHKDAPVIAFLNSAEGDEDIPTSVAGVVLGHELPLLSHLGVRARQQGVVFACSDGAEAYHTLKGSMASLWGKTVTLDVNIGGVVSVLESKGGAAGGAQLSQSTPQLPIDIASSSDMTATSVVTCSKVCVHIYIHICVICVYMYDYTHICMYVNIYLHLYIYIYIYIYICVNAH